LQSGKQAIWLPKQPKVGAHSKGCEHDDQDKQEDNKGVRYQMDNKGTSYRTRDNKGISYQIIEPFEICILCNQLHTGLGNALIDTGSQVSLIRECPNQRI
jgi:hypothetical protein